MSTSTMTAPEGEALPETLIPRKFNWLNASWITLTPVIAVVGLILDVHYQGFRWVDLIPLVFMYLFTGLAITVGYHRYYSHRAFECNRVMQFLILCFGAAAFQNSVLSWASDHRYHHRYTDREGDPYNINKGFFWAHMGWIYFAPAVERPYENARDLKKDSLVMWQHRWYFVIGAVVSFALPTLIGLAFGRPLEGFVWGGLVRMVLCHHATFLINSAAHVAGKQTYSDATTAGDSWWLAFLSFGEGYHNYHHTYPSDYRNGVRWHQWDPSKWTIRALSLTGVTWNLRRTSPRDVRPAA